MKDKKSFILYTDLIEVVEQLPNEEAGLLFKHILRYVNDLNPETDNQLTKLTFIPVKQGLKRDLEKYKNIVTRNQTNGAKGGRPKKTQINPEKPKKPVNDIVIVNDIDTRKEEFKNSLLKYIVKYNKNLLNDFYSYWTEHSLKDKKMRFEKEKSFGIERRLGTWAKNDKKFNSDNKPKSNVERIGSMNDSLDNEIEEMYKNE